jgi:hypothetical protein
MKFTVEQIEQGIAKCEDENKQFTHINLSLLPEGVKSGDILCFDGEKYEILTAETEKRKEKMLGLQARLFGKKNNF